MFAKSPMPDFFGNEVYEFDEVENIFGEIGRVSFLRRLWVENRASGVWSVEYKDGFSSNLKNSFGSQYQCIVLKNQHLATDQDREKRDKLKKIIKSYFEKVEDEILNGSGSSGESVGIFNLKL